MSGINNCSLTIKLKKLLKKIPFCVVRGSKEIEITGMSAHSKSVAPGHLFIAKKGLTHDGTLFIPDAIAAGAHAILTDIYNPFFPQITQIIAPHVEEIEAMLARHFFECSADHLFLVAITGTNGKTTTAYLVKHLLDAIHEKNGLIGTIERIVGKNILPSSHTTPDVITNYKLFHDMVMCGSKSCVMEVSSHALDQNRVATIEYDVAVFTNLTQDHLDYHHTMEQYAQAKALLFSSLKPLEEANKHQFSKMAIINADSPWHAQMIQHCRVPILTYGINTECLLKAEEITLTASGMQFFVRYQQQRHHFQSPLIGRFNVYNILAAIGVGLSKNIPLQQILSILSTCAKVPGRLEQVSHPKQVSIFVDFAHTEDALKNVLETLNEIKSGRLITLFGCGGNRDYSKRPKMGAVAEDLSDVVIITSDNPRQEDPHQIIQQIMTGFKDPSKAIVIVDRQEAIDTAIGIAHPSDFILIAGKGHEAYQIIGNQTIGFNDRLACRI